MVSVCLTVSVLCWLLLCLLVSFFVCRPCSVWACKYLFLVGGIAVLCCYVGLLIVFVLVLVIICLVSWESTVMVLFFVWFLQYLRLRQMHYRRNLVRIASLYVWLQASVLVYLLSNHTARKLITHDTAPSNENETSHWKHGNSHHIDYKHTKYIQRRTSFHR